MDAWRAVRRDNFFNRKGAWLERVKVALDRIREAGAAVDV